MFSAMTGTKLSALAMTTTPLVGDGEAVGEVVVEVVADAGVCGDRHVLVDDRAADLGAAADVDAVEQDRVFDVGVAVDADVRADDAAARRWPPETMQPGQTMLSWASPRRSGSGR